MRKGTLTQRPLVWGLFVVIVAVGGGLAAWPSLGGRVVRTFRSVTSTDQRHGALETLAVYGRVPDFALVERRAAGRHLVLVRIPF